MTTREQAEALGWTIWRQDHEPRWHGDDELERWFAERTLANGPIRLMAHARAGHGPDILEVLLSMIDGYEHQARRKAPPSPAVPVRTIVPGDRRT